MKVYGLSGKSGSGKSYNAIELSARLELPAIIDDGLFINEGAVAAGRSAKKAETKVGAIKTALFMDEAHRREVADAIKEISPSGVLVLGTSDRMVCEIAERLGLPEPEKILRIEEITTRAQREFAGRMRSLGGMHVIPAPTFQIKKQFSGYLLDAKKSFRTSGGRNRTSEKTLVRPTYSYIGKFEISDKVFADIIRHAVERTEGAAEVVLSSCRKEQDGIYLRAAINMKPGARVRSASLTIQKRVCEDVVRMTALNVLGVEIEVRGFVW